MKNILHLTYDLRDRFNRDKTAAVKNLIDQSKKFSNVLTIDLLRVLNFKEELISLKAENHLLINSFGLPYGLFLKRNLQCASKKIIKADQLNLIRLDSINLIHCHKLTFEGYIGYQLSKKLAQPLVVTLRQTDFQVLKFKPHYQSLYKKILKQTSIIFFIVPYMTELLQNRLGAKFFEEYAAQKCRFLPNIIQNQPTRAAASQKQKYLLTVVRMTRESVTRKNIKRLFRAISELDSFEMKLKVIGDGDYFPTVKSWVKKFNLNDKVEFIGSVKNEQIAKYYAEAYALVLPSKSESFGMVYAESLLNGTPILYAKKTGFDGLFENVGIAVDPFSLTSIKSGLIAIIKNNNFYRDSIQDHIAKGSFDIFNAQAVAHTYQNAIVPLL